MTCVTCGRTLGKEYSVTPLGATHYFDCSRRASVVCHAILVADRAIKEHPRALKRLQKMFTEEGQKINA